MFDSNGGTRFTASGNTMPLLVNEGPAGENAVVRSCQDPDERDCRTFSLTNDLAGLNKP